MAEKKEKPKTFKVYTTDVVSAARRGNVGDAKLLYNELTPHFRKECMVSVSVMATRDLSLFAECHRQGVASVSIYVVDRVIENKYGSDVLKYCMEKGPVPQVTRKGVFIHELVDSITQLKQDHHVRALLRRLSPLEFACVFDHIPEPKKLLCSAFQLDYTKAFLACVINRMSEGDTIKEAIDHALNRFAHHIPRLNSSLPRLGEKSLPALLSEVQTEDDSYEWLYMFLTSTDRSDEIMKMKWQRR